MRPSIFLLIILTFALFSCDSQNRKTLPDEKISIVGKWQRFSVYNGYTEFDIDSQYVVFFNQKAGRYKLPYKIENDSFKYLTHDYSGLIKFYGDSIYLVGNDSTTATLYRFNEPNIPFEIIPDEKDSLLFEAYLKGFDKRMIYAFEKAGIKFFDMEEQGDSTFQQLMEMKNN